MYMYMWIVPRHITNEMSSTIYVFPNVISLQLNDT